MNKRYVSALRMLDVLIALTVIICLSPVLAIVWLINRLYVREPLLFQTRIGQHKKTFNLLKFRTMYANTSEKPTHQITNNAVTPFGKILRKSKIDELPQLYNVLRGEMSCVGPRPSLATQHDVINAREVLGVLHVRPGITGLSQIKKIDMSEPKNLAETDAEMVRTMSVKNYFVYLFLTLCGRGSGDNIAHVASRR